MSIQNKIEELNEHFKLPIYFNKNKTSIKANIVTDLELIKPVDINSDSIYSYYFNVNNSKKNPFSAKIMEQVSEFYTTDIDFIKDNQTLLKTFTHINTQYHEENKQKYDKIIQTWNEIKGDTGFKERYYYIDWPMWDFLNNSQPFLQFMSIYNMTSPVISLFVPIIILIIPFFIIRLKGLKLTMQEYIDILKN
jgi:hypothetical protein